MQTIYAEEGQTWRINGVACDGIDMRFEDWASGKNNKRDPLSDMPLSVPSKHGPILMQCKYSFSVPIGGKQFVNVIGQNKDPFIGALYKESNLAPAFLNPKKITVTDFPMTTRIDQLNPNWLFFAALYRGNDLVKAPEYPRNESEKSAAKREENGIKWKPHYVNPKIFGGGS